MKFNSKLFRADVKTKRTIDNDLSLRDVATKIKISAPTISRIENGKTPDIISYGRLCKWLNQPLEKYLN